MGVSTVGAMRRREQQTECPWSQDRQAWHNAMISICFTAFSLLVSPVCPDPMWLPGHTENRDNRGDSTTAI
jgi:hypothetical protein